MFFSLCFFSLLFFDITDVLLLPRPGTSYEATPCISLPCSGSRKAKLKQGLPSTFGTAVVLPHASTFGTHVGKYPKGETAASSPSYEYCLLFIFGFLLCLLFLICPVLHLNLQSRCYALVRLILFIILFYDFVYL
jgi:hypothetical protein